MFTTPLERALNRYDARARAGSILEQANRLAELFAPMLPPARLASDAAVGLPRLGTLSMRYLWRPRHRRDQNSPAVNWLGIAVLGVVLLGIGAALFAGFRGGDDTDCQSPESAFRIAGSGAEVTAGGRSRTASHAAFPLAR